MFVVGRIVFARGRHTVSHNSYPGASPKRGMQNMLDTALGLLVALVDVGAAVALAALGLGAELTSASTFGTDTTTALWMAYIGVVALVAGWTVLTDRLLPRVVPA
jgi:general stress protein CsbA